MLNPLSIYIHYPFCISKCPYCSFNSHVCDNIDHDKIANSYIKELEFYSSYLKNRNIGTIFFGGGTPSLMQISSIENILNKINEIWNIDKKCEITIEANPTSIEIGKLQDIRSLGINRLSLGIQSLKDESLAFLGRNHSRKDAISAINAVSKIFDNYSCDLIYARPNQKLLEWEKELKEAISFSPNHLSLYQLTIEKGTKFYKMLTDGEIFEMSEDLRSEIYHLTNDITKEYGFRQYEISNYAKNGYKSLHNLAYWKSEDFLGIGAGSHSRVYLDDSLSINDEIFKKYSRIEFFTRYIPESWVLDIKNKNNAIQKIENLCEEKILDEIILMGLRLEEGVDNKIFLKHFKKDILEIFDEEKIKHLVNKKLIIFDGNSIKIPQNSRIFTDHVISLLLHSY